MCKKVGRVNKDLRNWTVQEHNKKEQKLEKEDYIERRDEQTMEGSKEQLTKEIENSKGGEREKLLKQGEERLAGVNERLEQQNELQGARED